MFFETPSTKLGGEVVIHLLDIAEVSFRILGCRIGSEFSPMGGI
jgi:hypothetical protein